MSSTDFRLFAHSRGAVSSFIWGEGRGYPGFGECFHCGSGSPKKAAFDKGDKSLRYVISLTFIGSDIMIPQ